MEITNSNKSTQLATAAGTLRAGQADHIQSHEQHGDLIMLLLLIQK
jgi:hypothetical protein